ncbi:hypothetical protein [Lichenicola sp.]|uniref:hypothetical protein n=1 Tax=Lichenicola sp. TaxID=2804529 RepID=UPI003AFF6D83
MAPAALVTVVVTEPSALVATLVLLAELELLPLPEDEPVPELDLAATGAAELEDAVCGRAAKAEEI